MAKEVDATDGLLEISITFGQRLDDKTTVFGPAHGRYIEVLFRLVEAHVAVVHVAELAVVEALGIDFDVSLGHGPLAELHPRTSAKDALAVLRHPGFQVVQYAGLFFVVGAVGTQGDGEQQVAVFRHDVYQLAHYVGGTLVMATLVDARVVMPAADAVARLPRLVHNLVWCAAFHVPRQCLSLVVVQNLAEDHAAGILIIKVGSYAQAAVTQRVERQDGDIEIDEVGLVAVDGIERAVVEVGDELRRRRAGTVAPVPLRVYAAVVP